MAHEENPKLRVVGIVIGFLSLIGSVIVLGAAVVFILPASIFGNSILPVYIALAFQLLANVVWLYGTISYKPVFMLLPILWWTLPAGFCLCFIFIGIVRGLQYLKVENLESDEFPFYEIVAGSLIFLAFYIITILCYRSMKRFTIRNTESDPRPNVKYEITKGNAEQSQRLRIYPTLVLEV